MQRAIIIALATTLTAVAVPSAAYYLKSPGDVDPIGDTLRGYGFLKINPPSTLMELGSLYYVDAAVKEFKAICHARKGDLDGEVITSRSWEMQQDLERNGRFATDVKLDFGSQVGGDVDNNYVLKVHSSLTDVVLQEIPLGASWLVFAKLMERPECNKEAMRHVHAGGYVCQGQKILQATVEIRLDRDAQSKIATHAKVTPDEVKAMAKLAIETQSDHDVVERQGQVFVGPALKYGVSMSPLCLAPVEGRFDRVLPRTTFDSVVNFVLLRIVEPMLPAKDDRSQVAQAAAAGAQ
jgi:hypothetical protein